MTQPPYLLLVEDNEDDIQLILRALRDNPLAADVLVMRSGKDALAFLHGHAGDSSSRPDALPSAVILDLGLPGAGGLDILTALRSDPRTALLPVILHTASLDHRDIYDAVLRGAHGYVGKTHDLTALRTEVTRVAQRWTELVSVPTAPTPPAASRGTPGRRRDGSRVEVGGAEGKRVEGKRADG